jgi:hypothetical protein
MVYLLYGFATVFLALSGGVAAKAGGSSIAKGILRVCLGNYCHGYYSTCRSFIRSKNGMRRINVLMKTSKYKRLVNSFILLQILADAPFADNVLAQIKQTSNQKRRNEWFEKSPIGFSINVNPLGSNH